MNQLVDIENLKKEIESYLSTGYAADNELCVTIFAIIDQNTKN